MVSLSGSGYDKYYRLPRSDKFSGPHEKKENNKWSTSNQSKKSSGGDSQALILVVYLLFMSKIEGMLLPETCRCELQNSPSSDNSGSGPVTLSIGLSHFPAVCHSESCQLFNLRYLWSLPVASRYWQAELEVPLISFVTLCSISLYYPHTGWNTCRTFVHGDVCI
jgi:hypothetical protein